MIDNDRASLRELKLAYKKAHDAKVDRFDFKGRILLVTYAKYLIEYLEREYARLGLRESERVPIDDLSKAEGENE